MIFLLTDSVYCGKYYPFPQTSSQDFTLTDPTPSVAVQVAEPLQSNLSRTNLNASPIDEIQERRCKGSALNAMFILKDIIYCKNELLNNFIFASDFLQDAKEKRMLDDKK